MTTPTTDKPVCGPSIEPLRELVRLHGPFDGHETATKALAAYDALKAENERLVADNKRMLDVNKLVYGQVQAHRDALKKAKVLLESATCPNPCPVWLAQTEENERWLGERKRLLATINALNL